MKKTASAFIGTLFCLGLGSVAGSASAQVIHRCLVDGQYVYQQDACPRDGDRLVRDRRGELVPQPEEPPRPPRPAAPAASAGEDAPATPAARPRATAARSRPAKPVDLRAEAEACMAWYRPMLRDAQTAYHAAPRRQGQELVMMIHAPDGHGGFEARVASCEIGADGLDAAATQAHALRRGWKAPAAR